MSSRKKILFLKIRLICIPSSRFNRFFFKQGPLVEMSDHLRIGQGGFGMVFKLVFHGKEMAAKCVNISRLREINQIQDDKEETVFDRNLSEYRIQLASAGSGILLPEAFVRQQNHNKLENGNWIAENYNIFIYPLYDCNLYEFHIQNYNNFTENILGNILHQCLTRECSILKYSKMKFYYDFGSFLE